MFSSFLNRHDTIAYTSLQCLDTCTLESVSLLLKIYINLLTLRRPAEKGDFQKKKHRNARGFAREFLQSYNGYEPGRSVKRRSKSSSLHSKQFFVWVVRIFCE